MKKLILLFALVASIAVAQTPEPAPAASPWKHTLIGNAGMTQMQFTDWAQGGENALTYAVFFEGKSAFAQDAVDWVNSYKFGYGQAKLGSNSIRKTDDKIDLESVLTYKMGTYVNPYVSASLKSQFTTGYAYSGAVETPISGFFDPAYLTQAAGVGYQPMVQLKTRLGAALREIITNKYTNYSGGNTTQVDGGLESVTDLSMELMENIVLTSKLEMFAPLKEFDVVTVRNDNTISAKVNKWIGVNFNLVLLQEPKVQTRTQVKQTLSVGVTYSIF